MKQLQLREDLPSNVMEVLREFRATLAIPVCLARLKEEVLTVKENELVDVASAQATKPPHVLNAIVEVVTEQRTLTIERALLDFARSLDMVGRGRYEHLRREIGEPIDIAHKPNHGKRHEKPKWDRGRGVLTFNGEIARKVPVRERPTYAFQILNAFAAAKWKRSIPEPFNGRLAAVSLHQAIHGLNEGLVGLKFHMQASASQIRWEDISEP